MVLIVAFSFAMGEHEPNPCNIRLANAVLRTVDALLRDGKKPIMVVAQWEIYTALHQLGYHPSHLYEVNYYQTQYLGSEGVWDSARDVILEQPEITEVVLVAHRFLHLHKVKQLASRNSNLITINSNYEKLIGHIGYYRKSLQWWTRGPVRLLLYSVRQALRRRRGWSLWAR